MLEWILNKETKNLLNKRLVLSIQNKLGEDHWTNSKRGITSTYLVLAILLV